MRSRALGPAGPDGREECCEAQSEALSRLAPRCPQGTWGNAVIGPRRAAAVDSAPRRERASPNALRAREETLHHVNPAKNRTVWSERSERSRKPFARARRALGRCERPNQRGAELRAAASRAATASEGRKALLAAQNTPKIWQNNLPRLYETAIS